jgi:hypothetical protein
MKGKHSEEAKRKMSESAKRRGVKPPSRLGVPNSEEQKQKISETLKRKGHKPVPQYGDDNPSKRLDVRAKISAALTGKPLSEEHKQSLSRNHRKTNPPGFSKKHSLSMRERVANFLYPWVNGNTPEAIKVRNSTDYSKWRTAVFERDNYTCQGCKQRGGRLNAHHKKSFAKHPELRLDVSNGITLCKSCHTEEHRKGLCHD